MRMLNFDSWELGSWRGCVSEVGMVVDVQGASPPLHFTLSHNSAFRGAYLHSYQGVEEYSPYTQSNRPVYRHYRYTQD